MTAAPTLSQVPTPAGRFGAFGGSYVPETLVAACQQLAAMYEQVRADPTFWAELEALQRTYVGRPTPLYHAKRLTEFVRSAPPPGGRGLGGGLVGSGARAGASGGSGDERGNPPLTLSSGRGIGTNPPPAPPSGRGANIWLKREDLAHTGAHKINNTLGQALLTLRMGKKRIIAETGAGQHGVASATAAAHFGLQCDVYMGSEDVRRQRLNVVRMRLMGARVVEVNSGSRTLKDATNEAMRDWMGSVEGTHYIIGSVVGPHPFPMIVRDFQSVIGRECRGQALEQIGQLPDAVIACVGGGSNAAGIFYPFVEDSDVQLIGVEAGGRSNKAGDHAAPLSFGTPGVLHGSMSYVLQDPDGQTADVHSCSAGLDYPGVGPEHSYWKDAGRVAYTAATDSEALEAFTILAKHEGIIPALESSHAISHALKLAATMSRDQHIVVNLSGRGDKDVDEATRLLGLKA